MACHHIFQVFFGTTKTKNSMVRTSFLKFFHPPFYSPSFSHNENWVDFVLLEVYSIQQSWNDFSSELVILLSALDALFRPFFVQIKYFFLNFTVFFFMVLITNKTDFFRTDFDHIINDSVNHTLCSESTKVRVEVNYKVIEELMEQRTKSRIFHHFFILPNKSWAMLPFHQKS